MTEPSERSEAPLEVHIAADPATVWRALRDPDLVRRWHGWQVDGLDDEVRIIYVDDVRADDERHVLVLGGGDTFTVTPAPGGVIVRVTRAPRGADPKWDAYYDDITEGWTAFLQQLRFAVERHGLAERQSLALTGTLRESVAPLDAALGLAEAVRLPVGARYEATLATGDRVTGSVVAHPGRQHALAVDQLGDGLLVLAERSPGDAGSTGATMVLLTAYGLPDDQFADLSARWTSWWNTVSQPAEDLT